MGMRMKRAVMWSVADAGLLVQEEPNVVWCAGMGIWMWGEVVGLVWG